jgi:hypothetical protein
MASGGKRQGTRFHSLARHHRSASRRSSGVHQPRHGEHECPLAEAPQLLPFDELASLANHSEAALCSANVIARFSLNLISGQRIIERERNPERRDFYQLCWHLGGSQRDIASLNAEDIDWQNFTIAYARKKTGSIAIIHFGDELAAILKSVPQSGPLFPYLRTVRRQWWHDGKRFH